MHNLWKVYWPLSGILAGAIIILAVGKPLPPLPFWMILAVYSIVVALTRYIADRSASLTKEIEDQLQEVQLQEVQRYGPNAR
jgi:hypothetical protein